MKKVSTLSFALTAALSLAGLNLPFIFAQETNLQIEAKADEQTIYEKIDQLTNTKGEFIEKEGVYRVGFPRSDIKPNIAGVKFIPEIWLSIWAGFKITGNNSIVVGDMVLLEDQVNPVLDAALESGLEVSALHSQFLWDSPKIMFMHIMGSGNTEKLAAAVGKVFAKIRETSEGKGEKPYADIDPVNTTLDPKKIEDIIGVKGQMASGVYKIIIGRIVSMDNIEIGNAMGVNTWAAFSGSDDKAVVDGDFAMLEQEVQPVLKSLRGSGINITAIHNHMLMDSPRMVFLHFWGVGSTINLAKGLRSALDMQ
ncbi:MAG: DUF1259 domain-containing protein [Candidatus Omnitrophica bacterium]|nr:DUF1259 domain-containing protein [Candidatus Omnitrophota bacterium]